MVRGGRLPCHPKEPADLEVGGEMRKKRKEPVETAAGQ